MRAATVVAMLMVVSGCANEQPDDRTARGAAPDTVAVDSSMALVARAAGVAIAMDTPGANADSVLAASGLTIDAYESLMYRIAADTALSRSFQEAVAKR